MPWRRTISRSGRGSRGSCLGSSEHLEHAAGHLEIDAVVPGRVAVVKEPEPALTLLASVADPGERDGGMEAARVFDAAIAREIERPAAGVANVAALADRLPGRLDAVLLAPMVRE